VRDVETHEQTIKDVEFNFIELPKFDKQSHELETLIEKWVYFIKNAENLDMIPENVDDEGLKGAYQEANKHTWTREELETYDYAFMREEDERAKLDSAEKRGVQKNQIETAKNFIALGLDNATIAQGTGLTLAQVEQLRGEAG
jgi:predicted transposase/invertase (TIGR01784 family)